MARDLSTIARDVRKHWKRIPYSARPYVDALASIRTVQDIYINESSASVVRGFLDNAATWRGEDAKRVKAEVRAMVRWNARSLRLTTWDTSIDP